MTIRNKLTYYLPILLMGLFLSSAQANELEYQEEASKIIYSNIKNSSNNGFLNSLYKELLFTPVWIREESLSTATKELFSYIKDDSTLESNTTLYRDAIALENISKKLYDEKEEIYIKVNLELKISKLYKRYTDYLYFGSINWGAFSARISNLMVNDVRTEWVLHRPSADASKILSKVAFGSSLKKELNSALPTAYHYAELKNFLNKYLEIRQNGGWQSVVLSSTKLKPNRYDNGIDTLRQRLKVTGDYDSSATFEDGTLYDKPLQVAVKKFQKRNGLKEDGIIGKGTLEILNKTVDERITTLRLNLDRLKWLNKRDSKRHIVINIPDFQLYFEDDGEMIQTMRVVTGRPNHPTPIFSDMVEYIVLNPYWNIPKSIIQKEMIPKLLRNSNAMARQGIEIHSGWGKDAKKISGRSVNWAKYRYSNSVPFRFAQVPGKRNALGKVKFLFPNKFSVYMHDTPQKHLFRRDKRSFSHGCIRLHKPRELLKTFATFNDNVDFKQSQKRLRGKKKKYLVLNEKVPIDVVYLTSWVDYDGNLQFREDIYSYDEMQLKSFRKW